MSAGLLGLHAGNLFIVHNCPPWMQGRYTSSMWERESGVIVGKDLDGRYWGTSGVKSEILICMWLRRVMSSKQEVALGGRAC